MTTNPNQEAYQIDTSGPIYVGTASSGALVSEAKWSIEKITIDGAAISILHSGRNQIWTNRASVIYG